MFNRSIMSSQPIVVPGSDHRSQSETHSVAVGSASDSSKTMTSPNVNRSLSNRKYDLYHITFKCCSCVIKNRCPMRV